tara:strand:- start:1404 stop:1721 length:318 start_codon:yes stop_codon:yes gene_type:complete
MRFINPPGFIVRINAAAPMNVGKTSGIGNRILHKRFPHISVRLVNQAIIVPTKAAVRETVKAKEKVLQRGASTLWVLISPIGSDSSVKLRHIRYSPGKLKRNART